MNALQNQAKRAIRDHRNECWKAKLLSLDPEDRNFWSRKDAAPPRPLHGTHGLVYTAVEKAEVFADSLERQCREVEDNTNDNLVRQVKRHLRQTINDKPITRLKFTSPKEIQTILKNLKIGKAPGPDGITNTALRLLPAKGICHIVAIVNASLRLRHLPQKWKLADVIKIPKPGKDRSFPQNFRPISLLPTLSKCSRKLLIHDSRRN
jgi:hypothetical protein